MTASTANGLNFDWATFDEGYGGKPEFLRGLSVRHQEFVGEVPRNFMGWVDAPRVVARPYHKNRRGRGRKVPRLASGGRPACRVDEMLVRPPTARSALAAVAGQGRAEGADGLGGRTPAVLPRRGGRPAGEPLYLISPPIP